MENGALCDSQTIRTTPAHINPKGTRSITGELE
jgi:hypothetical protein